MHVMIDYFIIIFWTMTITIYLEVPSEHLSRIPIGGAPNSRRRFRRGFSPWPSNPPIESCKRHVRDWWVLSWKRVDRGGGAPACFGLSWVMFAGQDAQRQGSSSDPRSGDYGLGVWGYELVFYGTIRVLMMKKYSVTCGGVHT